ncbi:MAG: hypothetical protein ACI4MM_04155 [Candidatus Ventricola sp.]
MGIISERRRKQRAARMRRRLMVAAGTLLLGVLAMAPGLREKLRSLSQDVQTFADGAQQTELTLPAREIYALQLAVFDSGERAADEARRLQARDVRCIVWQREKMRIVSSVAFSRDALDFDTAKGKEAYVIQITLEEVPLRLSCNAADMAQAQALMETPDSVLTQLLEGEAPLEDIRVKLEETAGQALGSHPENTLYTQLAQSLVNWCTLMKKTIGETDEKSARSYAAVTMCTLCRELRLALSSQSAAQL